MDGIASLSLQLVDSTRTRCWLATCLDVPLSFATLGVFFRRILVWCPHTNGSPPSLWMTSLRWVHNLFTPQRVGLPPACSSCEKLRCWWWCLHASWFSVVNAQCHVCVPLCVYGFRFWRCSSEVCSQWVRRPYCLGRCTIVCVAHGDCCLLPERRAFCGCAAIALVGVSLTDALCLL